MKWAVVALGVVFLGSGCTQLFKKKSDNHTPNKAVASFLKLSSESTKPEDKEKLAELCAGEMRRAFERMSDQLFRLAYIDTQVRILKLDFTKEHIDADKAVLGYRVVVRNEAGADKTEETLEREVELKQIEGVWYLEEIRTLGKDAIVFAKGMIF